MDWAHFGFRPKLEMILIFQEELSLLLDTVPASSCVSTHAFPLVEVDEYIDVREVHDQDRTEFSSQFHLKTPAWLA